jgi:hypothetical protein
LPTGSPPNTQLLSTEDKEQLKDIGTELSQTKEWNMLGQAAASGNL